MNTLEPLYTVGLTKLTFMQQFLVQNCKKSNTRIFFLQISTLYNALNFCMQVHTFIGSLYKKFRN
jgi:hypothetical protein